MVWTYPWSTAEDREWEKDTAAARSFKMGILSQAAAKGPDTFTSTTNRANTAATPPKEAPKARQPRRSRLCRALAR